MRTAVVCLALVTTPLWACRPTAPPAATGQPSGQSSRQFASDLPGDRRDPSRHAIVISIDGLLPQSYTDPDKYGLAVPTLRQLRRDGAYSPGALSVFPSVTYPAHTTMVTGVVPASHGINTNTAWDPTGVNDGGWNWYAEDIRVPTLWQAAGKAGLRTALIGWPVTVGAAVDALLPEYWRAGTADDRKLLRALSTPGWLDAIDARFPGFLERLTPPNVSDDIAVDAAAHLLDSAPPNLMLVHLWQTDIAHHRYGPWSDEAKQSLERADQQLARLIAAIKRAGIWPHTLLAIVSDHGFMPVAQRIRLGVLLKEMNLITPIDDRDTIADDWKAVAVANGGSAYVYLRDDGDRATAEALRQRLRDLADDRRQPIANIFDREQIRARGGDPRAFVAVEANTGFVFAKGHHGAFIAETKQRGHHGFDPTRPGMKAALLLSGPGVRPGPINNARLIDLAPTIAAFLAIPLPSAQGRPLAVKSAPNE